MRTWRLHGAFVHLLVCAILFTRPKAVKVYLLTRVERRKTKKEKKKSMKKMAKFNGDSKETPLPRCLIHLHIHIHL